MELEQLKKNAILGLKTLSLKEIKEKREKLDEEKKKMLADKAFAVGTSDQADVATTCSSSNILGKSISKIGEEIDKLVGAQGYLDFLRAENTLVIDLWSLVQVEYEDAETEKPVEKFYLISSILPGAVAFSQGDLKVHVVSPDSRLGLQMIGEGVGSQINCNLEKTPHTGTIIGFA